jgi:mycothiol synthase
MSSAVEISTVDSLTQDQQEQVFNIVKHATQVDLVNPLNEHAELHLKHGGDKPISHILATKEGRVVGYGHLDQTDLVSGPAAEIVVDPEFRNQGIAKLILRKIEELSNPKPLRLWAHGNVPAAKQFTKNLNYEPIREIIQLKLSLLNVISDLNFANEYKVSTYQGDEDNETILQINKNSFSKLPDQAAWNSQDLQLRLNEHWFDPEGLLILRKDIAPVAFCWTKIHTHDEAEHQPLGEIYVLAVLPEFQNRGLGKQLMFWGLQHLRKKGLSEAILYVDAKNLKAMKIYQEIGFVHSGSDTLYKSLT